MEPNMAAPVVTPDNEWKRMWRAADNSSVKAACIENYLPHGRREPILDAFKQLIDAFGQLVSKEALDLNMANTIAGLLDAQREFLLVSHDPLLHKMEHYLPGLQQEVRLCLIGRSEYWKGRAREHGFVADAQALQKSVTDKSLTDQIFAAGGNSPEGIRRLIESGGEGLSPAVQEVFRGARQILLDKAWETEQKVARAEKSDPALLAANGAPRAERAPENGPLTDARTAKKARPARSNAGTIPPWAEELKSMRNTKGLSRADLARTLQRIDCEARVSVETIKKHEEGHRPETRTQEAYGKFYGKPVSVLFPV